VEPPSLPRAMRSTVIAGRLRYRFQRNPGAGPMALLAPRPATASRGHRCHEPGAFLVPEPRTELPGHNANIYRVVSGVRCGELGNSAKNEDASIGGDDPLPDGGQPHRYRNHYNADRRMQDSAT